MEKDIKILEESIIQEKYHLYKNDLKKCVSNVIKAYKELKEENRNKQKTIETMRYIKAICRTQEDTYLLDKDICVKKNKYMIEVENGEFVDLNELYKI